MHLWKVNEWTTCSYACKFKESINEKSCHGKFLFFSLSHVKDVFFLNRRLLFQWKQIRTKIQRIRNVLAFESSLYLSLSCICDWMYWIDVCWINNTQRAVLHFLVRLNNLGAYTGVKYTKLRGPFADEL